LCWIFISEDLGPDFPIGSLLAVLADAEEIMDEGEVFKWSGVVRQLLTLSN